MAGRSRRSHSLDFKAKVALAAIKDDKILTELSQQFDAHTNNTDEPKGSSVLLCHARLQYV